MPDTFCQQAVERVMTYLRDNGVGLGAETCQQALRLVDSAMTRGDGPDLPARCIELMPDYFDLPGLDVPPPNPPLIRGHLGYYPND